MKQLWKHTAGWQQTFPNLVDEDGATLVLGPGATFTFDFGDDDDGKPLGSLNPWIVSAQPGEQGTETVMALSAGAVVKPPAPPTAPPAPAATSTPTDPPAAPGATAPPA